MNNESPLAPGLHQVQDSLLNSERGVARTAAETLFPGLVWIDDVTAYCPCPGQDKHTGKNGPRDCQVKIDGVPTVYCVHESCGEEIKSANKTLRDALKTSTPIVLTPEQKKLVTAAKAKARQEGELKVRAKKSLPNLLKTYAWSYDQIVADSPNPIQPDDRQGMFQAFMRIFENKDVVWIGDVCDTGKPHHAANFQPKGQWLVGAVPAGPFTCPSCFIPGSVSRSKDQVAVQRYLVVESDSMSKNEVGAIFRWLDQAVELSLRAVVDTAGKSLHGWFEYPPDDVLAELKIMLPVMSCDPKMFGASQPCRLPGGVRDGRIQRLIYFRNGGSQ